MESSEFNCKQTKVCIIGSGITGLSAAWDLVRQGKQVLVLESTLQPGGMLSSFNIGRDKIEHIYHHLFTSDACALSLISDLGLSEYMRWYSVKDALFAGGRLYPFSSPIDLLKFSELPLFQRIKTGLTVLKAARIKDWQELENMTAAEWLIKNCGEKSYERLWSPLLRAKFDTDAKEVSAVWIWNKFKLRGSSRTSHGQTGKLGYMQGSFARLTEALTADIEAGCGKILYGYTAMGIDRQKAETGKNKYKISCILEDCSAIDFEADAVISTISTRQFANLSIGLNLPEDYREKLRSVRYKANICMVLRLKNALSPYYWNTICDDLPFVVSVEHTNMTGTAGYDGHIVYLSRYLDIADAVWTKSDGNIFQSFVAALCRIHPDFSTEDIIDWRIKRSRYAQPVIQRNYSNNRPEMNTPEPGVKLAGMAQIYPEDRGINYAIRLGFEAAHSVEEYLKITEVI